MTIEGIRNIYVVKYICLTLSLNGIGKYSVISLSLSSYFLPFTTNTIADKIANIT